MEVSLTNFALSVSAKCQPALRDFTTKWPNFILSIVLQVGWHFRYLKYGVMFDINTWFG